MKRLDVGEKNYDDIIDAAWPRPSLRSRMPLEKRAKIFLPFAALEGYNDALEETLRGQIQSVENEAKIEDEEDHVLPFPE